MFGVQSFLTYKHPSLIHDRACTTPNRHPRRPVGVGLNTTVFSVFVDRDKLLARHVIQPHGPVAAGDHLNGVLFIDKMSAVKRIALKGKLKRMKKETEARLGVA